MHKSIIKVCMRLRFSGSSVVYSIVFRTPQTRLATSSRRGCLCVRDSSRLPRVRCRGPWEPLRAERGEGSPVSASTSRALCPPPRRKSALRLASYPTRARPACATLPLHCVARGRPGFRACPCSSRPGSHPPRVHACHAIASAATLSQILP
jgi:hypothetical protein